jgi:hypothetical protein
MIAASKGTAIKSSRAGMLAHPKSVKHVKTDLTLRLWNKRKERVSFSSICVPAENPETCILR